MSKKAFKTVWEHWKMQRLPIPAALTVSGVNGEKIDVMGYVEISLTMKDGDLGQCLHGQQARLSGRCHRQHDQ
jgi:hypothetical protein